MKNIPLYKEIALKIEKYIADNNLPSGTRLPSARSMAKEYNVSGFTVFNALDELKYKGLIESKPQSGFYVSEDSLSLLFPKTPDWNKYMDMGIIQQRDTASDFFGAFKKSALNPLRIGGHLGSEKVLKKALENLSCNAYSFENFDNDYRGSEALRKAICFHVARWGIKATPEEVLITNGSFQALAIIKLAIMRPGMNMICEKFFLPKNDTAVTSYGIERKYIELDKNGIILDKLRETLSKVKRGVLISHFGATNPYTEDGFPGIVSNENKMQILKMCYASKVPIVDYDVYRDFLPQWSKPIKSMDTHNTVLHIGDLNTAFLANFRVGWIIGPNKLINKLADIYIQLEGCHNMLMQTVALELIGHGGLYYDYIENLKPILEIHKAAALSIIKKHLSLIATWKTTPFSLGVTIYFDKDINLKKMYENRGDIDFMPSYFLGKETTMPNLTLGIYAEPLDKFEDYVKKLTILAKMSRD